MVDNTALEKQIKIVARARDNKVSLDELKKRRLNEWEETNAALLSDIANNTAFLTEAENRLREITLQAYNETGNKQPAEGVGIREVTEIRYDHREAFAWAIKHTVALQLNEKEFEGIAKSKTPPLDLDFVVMVVVGKATIATDLSKYIKEVK